MAAWPGMGVVGFDTEVGPDVKRAEWENSVIEDPTNPLFGQLFVLADENHAIHGEHDDYEMADVRALIEGARAFLANAIS